MTEVITTNYWNALLASQVQQGVLQRRTQVADGSFEPRL